MFRIAARQSVSSARLKTLVKMRHDADGKAPVVPLLKDRLLLSGLRRQPPLSVIALPGLSRHYRGMPNGSSTYGADCSESRTQSFATDFPLTIVRKARRVSMWRAIPPGSHKGYRVEQPTVCGEIRKRSARAEAAVIKLKSSGRMQQKLYRSFGFTQLCGAHRKHWEVPAPGPV